MIYITFTIHRLIRELRKALAIHLIGYEDMDRSHLVLDKVQC
jgi:hypothetical protein